LVPVACWRASAPRSALLDVHPEAAYGDYRGDSELKLEDAVKRDLERLPEVRKELVERIKGEIASGSYMTPEKVRKAITELLRQLCTD